MATDAQNAANRRNAALSTGPRTKEGKEAIRSNAVTHGLASRSTAVDTRDGVESAADYDTLVNELQEDLQAEGRMEHILVEKIAFASLQRQRAVRAEAGAMRRRLRELEDNRRQQASADEYAGRVDLEALRRGDEDFGDDVHVAGSMTSSPENVEAFRAIVSQRLRTTAPGLTHLIETIDAAIHEVTRTHTIAADTVERLAQEFACEDPSLVARIHAVAQSQLGRKSFSESAEAGVLHVLRTEHEDLVQSRAMLVERSAELESTARAEASLPTDGELNRLQRYKAMYEREMASALNQLERLQRRRRGEASVPPISVSLEPGT